MRLVHLTWMSVVMALAMLGGCASRGSLEVLETELRQQEDQLAGLQQQLATTQSELQVSQNEVAQLRAQLVGNGQQSHSPEHLEHEFKAVGLRFNTYLTSGIDRDGQPGDELLHVLVYPHDDQGGLVKLPGTIELRALDLSAPDGLQEVGSWSFTAAQTKAAWHSGFLAAGFLFEEAWARLPQGSDVTLHARFKTIDGRQFDAVQSLKVSSPALSPVVQSLPSQTSVRASKPTMSPVGFDTDDELRDDQLEPAVNAERGVIETSDRYREYELPVIR